MILLIEPDKTTRKRLSDLLSRERIMGIDSVQKVLEMLCKYKTEINVIVANIYQLRNIVTNQTLFRLCEKYVIAIPPIVSYYREEEKKVKQEIERNNKQYRFIEYKEKDPGFVEKYIQAIRDVYPDLNADIEKAREVWSKQEQDEELVDLHKWIEEEGLYIEEEKEICIENLKEKAKKERREKEEVEEKIVDIEELGLLVEKPEGKQKIEQKTDENYRKMYLELKKTYDELLKYVKELMEFV
jgi:replicative DNA helicase